MATECPSTLTTGELAKLLGVVVSTVHNQVTAGFFSQPATTPGGHRRFNPDVVIGDYKRAKREAPRALVDYRERLAKASRKVGRAARASS